jgi:hypothetical protein
MENIDQEYPNSRTKSRKSHWPEDVYTVSTDGQDLLGADKSGGIYWDGARIEVAKTFSLTCWQKMGAVVGIASTVAVAAVEWLRFFGFGYD